MNYTYGVLLCRMSGRVTRSALVAHRYTYVAEARSTTGILFPSQCLIERSCWPRIRWCMTGEFQEQANAFFICLSCWLPLCLQLFSIFFKGLYCEAVVFRLIGCKSLSPSRAFPTTFNNNNNKIIIIIIIYYLLSFCYSQLGLYPAHSRVRRVMTAESEVRGSNPGAGCTKVLAVTVAKGERIHHDGCSRK